MKCPVCDVEMRQIEFKTINVDVCDTCQGIWCDKDELEKLARLDEAVLSDSPLSKSLLIEAENERKKSTLCCPSCEASMDKYEYSYDSGIMLDTCKICGGSWIDDGELKSIIDYVFGSQEELIEPEEE